MPQQVLQQLEFPRRQLNGTAAPRDLPGDEIHVEIPDAEAKRIRRPPTANQRTYARQQFFERKRLDDVVIGTAVQAGHTVFQRVPGGQEKNRGLDPVPADRRQDLKAVAAWEHDVQKNQIEFFSVDPEECIFAGMREDSFVALARETFFQRVGDFDFIFDNENTHTVQKNGSL